MQTHLSLSPVLISQYINNHIIITCPHYSYGPFLYNSNFVFTLVSLESLFDALYKEETIGHQLCVGSYTCPLRYCNFHSSDDTTLIGVRLIV